MRSVNPLTYAFLKAAALAGHRFNSDFNGARQKGFGLYTFTQANGERVTAESVYIDPIRDRPNLTIFSDRSVTKLIMDGKRATGVAWRDADGAIGCTHGTEIILSAGSFVSPHLLLLSGIGDKSQLDQHGIPIVHDLPGVGENLQGHLDVSLEYRAKTLAPYGGSCELCQRTSCTSSTGFSTSAACFPRPLPRAAHSCPRPALTARTSNSFLRRYGQHAKRQGLWHAWFSNACVSASASEYW